MRRVWKYQAKPALFSIEMPQGAKVVAVGWQDTMVFWAVVDDGAPLENRIFYTAGTGHSLPQGVKHLGTAQAPDGLVWHLFEKDDAPAGERG